MIYRRPEGHLIRPGINYNYGYNERAGKHFQIIVETLFFRLQYRYRELLPNIREFVWHF